VTPPFFYGWIIVAISMLAGFFSAGVSNITMAVVLKPISDELGWSRALNAAAVTAGAIHRQLPNHFCDFFGKLFIVGSVDIFGAASDGENRGLVELWDSGMMRSLKGLRPSIKSQVQSGPERNIEKKVQLFRGPLAFSSTMEGVCSAQVQAQNKHSRACVRRGGRNE